MRREVYLSMKVSQAASAFRTAEAGDCQVWMIRARLSWETGGRAMIFDGRLEKGKSGHAGGVRTGAKP